MIQAPFLATAESIENAEQAVEESVQNMEAKTARLAKAVTAVGNAFGTGMAALVTGSKSAKVAIKDMVSTIVSGALRASQGQHHCGHDKRGNRHRSSGLFVIPRSGGFWYRSRGGTLCGHPRHGHRWHHHRASSFSFGRQPLWKGSGDFERMGEFLNMAGVGEGQHTQVTGRLQGWICS